MNKPNLKRPTKMQYKKYASLSDREKQLLTKKTKKDVNIH